MRSPVLVALALTALIGVAACEEDDGDGDENEYSATLTGAAERPTPVTNASTTGTFSLVDNGANMTYTLNLNGTIVGPVTGAHIHAIPRSGVAPADTTGGIVVNLSPGTALTGLLASGTITQSSIVGLGGAAAITMDSLRTLINAGRTYVNVHTQANPGGHIRGTIVRN
jgi:hypothetical protein